MPASDLHHQIGIDFKLTSVELPIADPGHHICFLVFARCARIQELLPPALMGMVHGWCCKRKMSKIKLQIWDLEGRGRYQAITHAYCRGTMGFILGYDVTDRSSFVSCQPTGYWITSICQGADLAADAVHVGGGVFFAAGVSFTLVGHKSDCDSRRQVSTSEGVELAAQLSEVLSIEVAFFETSAKTGAYVDVLFHDTVARCLEISRHPRVNLF